SADKTVVFPVFYQPLLIPLLHADTERFTRLYNDKVEQAPEDLLTFRNTFSLNHRLFTVVVAEDMRGLKNSQASLHTWTAVVSLLLILLLVGVIWFGI